MARNKKRIIEEIVVTDFAAEGKCIIKLENEIVFVPGANIAPGDKVKLVITKKKKSYSEGVVLEILEKSPIRIEHFCEHFGLCGGCKWQHIPYELQLEQKQKQVGDQLKRIGKVDISNMSPILPSKATTFYRNKLEFTFSKDKWMTKSEIATGEEITDVALGFHVPKRFDKILPINKCHLQADPSNIIRNFVDELAKQKGYAYYDHNNHKGFLRTLMIRNTSIGQVMVCFQFAQNNEEDIKFILDSLLAKVPEITSLFYFINQKGNDSYYDLDPIHYKGLTYIEEKMEELTFRIGPKSFYQTNSEQAYELYKVTRDFADIKESDVVYDLYTGTGTIANFVAHKAKKVVGIEYVEEAIVDAVENSKNNQIENTSFYAGDLKAVLSDELFLKEGKPDVIITDPPRAGMDKEVVEQILKSGAKTVVYVSCNAATQARDIALMDEKYSVEEIQPVDMFPHTHHVENVVKLRLK
ncbi:23S rRNA m(5)U-1939 methyltransferase [Spirosomataceae bacterium TFI 002]|nr:23S rRNA m(5)U-1939 methyltransferase [Spirosomataceae bacterium TFI 002]